MVAIWTECLPRRATGVAQGFNPGKCRLPDEARTSGRAKIQSAQLGRPAIGPSDPASALLGRSIWHPLQGALLLVEDSQELKPWA